jgi:TFIIF-interacting CTD phosphatase-like protein
MSHVILDIDNTLVDTRERPIFNRASTLKIASPDMYVYERPHLDALLNWLFKNYTVSLWTAGSKPYADWIEKNVIGVRHGKSLRHVLSARDCQTSVDMYGTLKSLRYLNQIDPSIKTDNVLLVDDMLSNCLHQRQNCVLVKAFDASEPDDELKLLPFRITSQFYNLAHRLG